jgi:hypothetical protein
MASIDNAFLGKIRKCVSRRHQADAMNSGQFPFRVNYISRLQLPGFNSLADRALNPLVRGLIFPTLRWHCSSVHFNPGLRLLTILVDKTQDTSMEWK